MDNQLRKYRDHLVEARQKAQEDYDKTVISLSGGGLGISFAFINDIIGDDPVNSVLMLILSWGSWALSSAVVLYSYFTSRIALEKTIKQVDLEKIYVERPGGLSSIITSILNILSGLFFLLGLILMIIFVYNNM